MIVRKENLKKSTIALIQLRKAIQLYNLGEYVSSITLAGASDDIFSGLALNLQGYNALDGRKHFWDDFAQLVGKDKPSKDKVKKVDNKTKNRLKHHDVGPDVVITADFEFEAQCHIDSAIRNYWIAFDKSPSDRIIRKYVDNNWT